MLEAKTEVTGTVWKIVAEVGQRVEAGEQPPRSSSSSEDGDPHLCRVLRA